MAKSPDKSAVKGKKKKRPKFCPNASRNSNLNSSRSNSMLHSAAEEELKKNNAELAKALNLHKEALARLVKEKQEQENEMMTLKMEISELRRASQDPGKLEVEVERRVREEVGRLQQDLRSAVEHTVGLSTILTRLVTTTKSRASLVPSAANRSSDVGGSRLRPVVGGGVSWARETSPPARQLSKVSPMVEGHAISRPRIQLTRMDLSAVQQVNTESELPTEQEEQEEPSPPPTPAVTVEDTESPNVNNIDDDEEFQPTPPLPPGRNPFDLTNIREESTFLEDSVLSTMEETLVTPNMEVVEEEDSQELDEEREEEEGTSLHLTNLTSTTVRQSTRLSLRPGQARALSPEAGRSPVILQPPPGVPGTSPYVLASQEVSPAAAAANPASHNNSASFSESFFLEQMGDIDPREGPSWLFASVKKKKKRKNASKKLSAIFSDLDVTANLSADNSGNFLLAEALESPALERGENEENLPDLPGSAEEPREQPGESQAGRTPLSPLTTHRDETGQLVNIREPRIFLSNVGTSNNSPAAKQSRNLDEFFSRVRSVSPSQAGAARSSKRKWSSNPDSEAGREAITATRGTKKPRATDLPRIHQEELSDNVSTTSSSTASRAVESSEGEGRVRRQRSQVSYKEPSLGTKLRQVKLIILYYFLF